MPMSSSFVVVSCGPPPSAHPFFASVMVWTQKTVMRDCCTQIAEIGGNQGVPLFVWNYPLEVTFRGTNPHGFVPSLCFPIVICSWEVFREQILYFLLASEFPLSNHHVIRWWMCSLSPLTEQSPCFTSPFLMHRMPFSSSSFMPVLFLHNSTLLLGRWPQLCVSVYTADSKGREEVKGYGCIHVPCGPGR